MYVKQVSVFLQNSKGKLSEVLGLLAKNNINIKALSIADTSDYGVLRLVVSQPEKAVQILKDETYLVSTSDVLVVSVDNTPGGLASAVDALKNADISVEYIYAFIGLDGTHALVIIRVDNIDGALDTLNKEGFTTISADRIYKP